MSTIASDVSGMATPHTMPPGVQAAEAAVATVIDSQPSQGTLAVSRPTTGLAMLVPSVSPERQAEKLNATSRKEFKVAIERRATNMKNALNGQMGGRIDVIISNLRIKANIIYTEQQLKEMIKKADAEIAEEANKYLGPEKLRIESEIETSNDEFSQQQREMKLRHKEEWNNLKKLKMEAGNKLRADLVTAEQRVKAEHTAHMLQKRNEYSKILTEVREKEARITNEAEAQVRLMDTRRNTINSLLEDCVGRAQEQILYVGTVGEAMQLVNMVPTVQAAMILAKSARGLAVLMHQLDPTSYAEPVDEEEISIEPTKATPTHQMIDADIHEHDGEVTVVATEAEEQEEADRLIEEEVDDAEDEGHDEIYADGDVDEARARIYGRR
jgi:hypothetical protein